MRGIARRVGRCRAWVRAAGGRGEAGCFHDLTPLGLPNDFMALGALVTRAPWGSRTTAVQFWISNDVLNSMSGLRECQTEQ